MAKHRDIEIAQLTLEEAWGVYKTECELGSKEYHKIRFGINLKFDINDHFRNIFPRKTKTGLIMIKGQWYATEDYYTELELRERVLKDWLQTNMGREEVAKPWGMTDD